MKNFSKLKVFTFVMLAMILFPSMLFLTACKDKNLKNSDNNSQTNAYYSVVFDSKGGTNVETLENVNNGSKISQPSVVEKQDYNFVGWYNGEKKWNFEEDTVSQNLTLTAKWSHIYFDFDENTNEITGLTELGKKQYNVVIPEKINEIDVLTIGKDAFSEAKASLTTIMIPKTLTKIDENAFRGCYLLREISFDGNSNLLEISNNAFYGCQNLKTVNLPSSLKSIGEYAFSNCLAISDIMLSNGLASIQSGAFLGCNNLTNVYYTGTFSDWAKISFSDGSSSPMNVNFSNSSHFYTLNSNNEFEEVTDILIDDSIDEIKIYSFSGFSHILNITLSQNLTEIKNNAFLNCSNLTSITLPNSLTKIGENVFAGCCHLTSIVLPSELTEIGENAFLECYSLVEIYNLSRLEISLTNREKGSVSYYAKDIYTSIDDESKLSISSGVIYYQSGLNKIAVSLVGSQIQDVVLDNDCTEINFGAFYGYNIESITLSENLEKIGDYAFCNCDKLFKITIPESVIFIGFNAFANCSSLQEVSFENIAGWICYQVKDSLDIIEISSEELSSSKYASSFLQNTYVGYYWEVQEIDE